MQFVVCFPLRSTDPPPLPQPSSHSLTGFITYVLTSFMQSIRTLSPLGIFARRSSCYQFEDTFVIALIYLSYLSPSVFQAPMFRLSRSSRTFLDLYAFALSTNVTCLTSRLL